MIRVHVVEACGASKDTLSLLWAEGAVFLLGSLGFLITFMGWLIGLSSFNTSFLKFLKMFCNRKRI